MTCYLEARYVGRDLLRSRAGHALHLARQHVVDRGPVPARQPLHQRWPLGHHTRRVVAEGPINACGHVPHRRRDHLFRHRIPGRNRYNFTERWAQMRSFLVVLLLLPIACSQPVTKQSNLEKKARCATIGRAFIKELERKTGGMPTIVDPTYAYNSAADTCLCRYGLHFGIPSTGNSCIIIDTLTNATMAAYDTSVANNDRERRRYEAAVAAMSEDRKMPLPDPAFR